MIPKIIHYCWFGHNDIPDKVKVCINSWKEKLPEYKIVLWNEDNFDVNMCQFTKQAYLNKKYAFVSDYVRFYALNKFGGIYLDTDVEVLKDFVDLLDTEYLLGFERENGELETHIIGSVQGHSINKLLLEYYNYRQFVSSDGKLDMRPNTHILSEIIRNHYRMSLELINKSNIGIKIYNHDYFCPLNLINGKLTITKNTYVIHWHTLLWVSKKTRLLKFLRQKVFIPIFGVEAYNKLEKYRKR